MLFSFVDGRESVSKFHRQLRRKSISIAKLVSYYCLCLRSVGALWYVLYESLSLAPCSHTSLYLLFSQ